MAIAAKDTCETSKEKKLDKSLWIKMNVQMFTALPELMNVPEVLNVQMNEMQKKFFFVFFHFGDAV